MDFQLRNQTMMTLPAPAVAAQVLETPDITEDHYEVEVQFGHERGTDVWHRTSSGEVVLRTPDEAASWWKYVQGHNDMYSAADARFVQCTRTIVAVPAPVS